MSIFIVFQVTYYVFLPFTSCFWKFLSVFCAVGCTRPPTHLLSKNLRKASKRFVFSEIMNNFASRKYIYI